MSELSQTHSALNINNKSLQQYSRNVKRLKLKLSAVEQQIESVQKKMKAFSSVSNDKMIALKISKTCKERKMTPEMIFRCADKLRKGSITKNVFKETIQSMGIKLSQNQITRLQYLLDEDISGEISFDQYNTFLSAFGIKGEFSSNQLFMKDLLKKIQVDKILDDDNPEKRVKQLLNYEQFLKYCHKNFPGLKDKQIASIFNLLQKDNMIDLQQFLDYIRRKQQDNDKISKKNKKKLSKTDSLSQYDANSLKGIIQALLKHRPKDSKSLFHIVEFTKVQRLMNKKKGELLQIFKQIDRYKKGSFGFNQLIHFYIVKERARTPIYAFELIGRKLYIQKQKPEDALCRYNGGPDNKNITIQQFKQFMLKQCHVIGSDSEDLYRSVANKQNQVPIKLIIDAMKLQEGQKKMVYIKPTIGKMNQKDFWKKNCYTILFNPFVALRYCITIQQQLRKNKQLYWDDYEFGPILQDPYGFDSIGFNNIQTLELKWLTVQSLGMPQFYLGANVDQFTSGNTSPHQTFPKTLVELKKQNQLLLESDEKVNYNVKQVTQANLKHLFSGVYPKIFRSFASVGIYVFRFFVRQKEAYVIVDNKIPCGSDGTPLFSYDKDMKLNWISLIEKAYAKIKGSYFNIFSVNSINQYIYELTRKVPVHEDINKEFNNFEEKQNLWQNLCEMQKQSKQNKVYAIVTDSASQNLVQNKVQTGIGKNSFNQIPNTVQISDSTCKNIHQSHRLLLLKTVKLLNQKVWNPNWNNGEDSNKYDKFLEQIEESLKNKSSNVSLSKDPNIIILNYKLFRSIFNQVLQLKNISFEKMIVLRKLVQFEQKFSCRYEINSKNQDGLPLSLCVTLNKIRSPVDCEIELHQKSNNNSTIIKKTTNKQFSAFQFKISTEVQYLQLKVTNFASQKDHIYSLTFYISEPKYHLKQLDRQILFKHLSPYEESCFLDFGSAQQKQKRFIYRNYFKAAQRSGCCG